MASLQAYIPPINPDSRPLPVGWTQHYDPQRSLWIYLDMNVLPPIASLIHPAGSMNNPLPIVPSPSSSSASPDPPGLAQSSATAYTSAIQAHGERQEKTLAQQLYWSALSHKPKQPSVSGGSPSPDYLTEDAAPAYSSADPSTFASAPIAGSLAATGANCSIASGAAPTHVSHPSTSSTSSSLRRPLPPPPSTRSHPSSPPQAPLSPPIPPPPFPEDIKGLVQPTPLKAANGHFHDGDRGNLANALLQAIPELDTPLPSTSAIREHRYIAQQASGLRSKPPSYSTATRPLTLRNRTATRPSPLPINDEIMSSAAFPSNTAWALANELTAQRVSEPQDDSDLIPPDSAATVSPHTSPVYVSGIPDEPIPMPQSRVSTPSLPPLPLSPTITVDECANSPSNPAHSPTPSPPQEVTVSPVPGTQKVPSEVPKKPPRNAFVPAQIMAIANRNMQAATTQDPDATFESMIPNHTSPLPLPSVPFAVPVERYPIRDIELSAGDGLALSDPPNWPSFAPSPSPMDSQSSFGHDANPAASSSRNLPRLVSNRDSGYVEVPPSSSFSALGLASGAGTKKESGMGGKFKKLGFGLGKAAGKGFAALKRPSAMASSTSLDVYGDGRAEASSSDLGFSVDKRLPTPPPHTSAFSTERLPSLIENVKIASPTLSAIPLPSDENGPNPPTPQAPSRPRSLYAQSNSAPTYHRMSYSHERPPPLPTHPSRDLQSFLDITPRESDAGRNASLGQGPRNGTGLSARSSESRSIHSDESSRSSKRLPQPSSIYGDSGPSQRGRNAANILASLGPQLGPDPPRQYMTAKAANLTAHLGALIPQHPPLQAWARSSGTNSNHSTSSISSTSNTANKAMIMFHPPHWGQNGLDKRSHRSGGSGR